MKIIEFSKITSVFIVLLLFLFTGCEEKETSEMIDKQIREFEASLPVENKELIKSADLSKYEAKMLQSIYYNKYDSLIYIIEDEYQKILIFDTDFNFKKSFGGYGQGPNEFRYIRGMCFLKNGKIVITDGQILKIFDKNLNLTYQKWPLIHIGGEIKVRADSNNLLYFNMGRENLFLIMNDKGDTIKTFGDLFPYDKIYIAHENKVSYDIDENNNLFCAFQNIPVIRKYNDKHILEYEVSYADIPYVKSRYAHWKKQKESKRDDFRFKLYNENLYVDNKFIYISFNSIVKDKGESPLLVFDKNNGKLLKTYDFEGEDVARSMIKFDFSNQRMIFSLYRLSINKYYK